LIAYVVIEQVTDSMDADVTVELKEAIERILQSPSRKKLVVAGPGTGKTTLFRALLELGSGSQKTRLVLTFINNLKKDLEKSLSDLARIYKIVTGAWHAY
jgi:hypothetical protein